MTVMKDPLLKKVSNVVAGPTGTVANIIKNGGQLGLGPHLTNIDSSTPLAFPPVVPVVTHIPTMLKKFENVPATLKMLIERHTKSITGIDFGYELEEGAGFTLPDSQEVKTFTKNKRTAISPNMVFPELNGNLVWNLFRFYLSLMNDADTHGSKLAALLTDEEIDPMVFSYFTMDILFIQFDVTMLPQNIIDAVFVTTMWPKNTGNIGMQKEVGTVQVQERSIDFNGVLQHNKNTYLAGVAIAEMLSLHKANFDFANPIATAIEDESTHMGMQQEIEEIMNEFKATQ
jgi:hypothetical protein